MSWFCSGYFPRRFILARPTGIHISDYFARVWKTRGAWNWVTCFNSWGSSPSASQAMKEAEEAIDQRLGTG